jgi:hypothetical protein
MYIQNSTNMFEVVKSTLTGLVPKFIVPEFGKLTAVLLVGASVTSAAEPWSCAGPGETCADGWSELTLSTFEFSNCHARLGWGSAPENVKDILFYF